MRAQLKWRELLILSLMWRGPITGYEVKRLILAVERVPSWTAITHSDIYHTLERLEKRGWAEKQPRQARLATPFCITEEGRRHLAEAVEFWLSCADHAYFLEFLLAVKFMDILPQDRVCKALTKRRQALSDVAAWVEGRLKKIESWPEQFKPNPDSEENLFTFARSQVQWTDDLMKRAGCSTAPSMCTLPADQRV